MSDDRDGPGEPGTRQQVVVASFLADVGRVSAIGPTVHVELGSTMPDGTAIHRAHVMLSREFAVELANTLLRALARQSAGEPAETELEH